MTIVCPLPLRSSLSNKVSVMRAINKAGFIDTPYPVQDSLFFKIQGDTETINLAYKAVQDTIQRHGSSRFQFAATDQEAEDIWQNRKYALMSTLAAEPGYRCWTTDVCVPVSRLPQLVYETKVDLQKSGLKSTIVGHVGDGKVNNCIA
jgi:D-lactate dehydrogenase (cytochrome)